MADKTQKTTFDVAAINRAYRDEIGHSKQEAEDDNRRMVAALGDSPQPRSLDLNEIADTFCMAWPKAKKFFKIAFGLAAWVPGIGNLVVMAKGVIAAIDKSVVPVICGVEAADPLTPPPSAIRDSGGVGSQSSGQGGGASGGGPRRRDPDDHK